MTWFSSFFTSKNTLAAGEWLADVSIAGMQHYRANDIGDLIAVGDKLELMLQPQNIHDHNAVMVLWQGNKLGYLPKALASELHALVEQNALAAEVTEINALRFGRKWLKLRLRKQ